MAPRKNNLSAKNGGCAPAKSDNSAKPSPSQLPPAPPGGEGSNQKPPAVKPAAIPPPPAGGGSNTSTSGMVRDKVPVGGQPASSPGAGSSSAPLFGLGGGQGLGGADIKDIRLQQPGSGPGSLLPSGPPPKASGSGVQKRAFTSPEKVQGALDAAAGAKKMRQDLLFERNNPVKIMAQVEKRISDHSRRNGWAMDPYLFSQRHHVFGMKEEANMQQGEGVEFRNALDYLASIFMKVADERENKEKALDRIYLKKCHYDDVYGKLCTVRASKQQQKVREVLRKLLDTKHPTKAAKLSAIGSMLYRHAERVRVRGFKERPFDADMVGASVPAGAPGGSASGTSSSANISSSSGVVPHMVGQAGYQVLAGGGPMIGGAAALPAVGNNWESLAQLSATLDVKALLDGNIQSQIKAAACAAQKNAQKQHDSMAESLGVTGSDEELRWPLLEVEVQAILAILPRNKMPDMSLLGSIANTYQAAKEASTHAHQPDVPSPYNTLRIWVNGAIARQFPKSKMKATPFFDSWKAVLEVTAPLTVKAKETVDWVRSLKTDDEGSIIWPVNLAAQADPHVSIGNPGRMSLMEHRVRLQSAEVPIFAEWLQIVDSHIQNSEWEDDVARAVEELQMPSILGNPDYALFSQNIQMARAKVPADVPRFFRVFCGSLNVAFTLRITGRDIADALLQQAALAEPSGAVAANLKTHVPLWETYLQARQQALLNLKKMVKATHTLFHVLNDMKELQSEALAYDIQLLEEHAESVNARHDAALAKAATGDFEALKAVVWQSGGLHDSARDMLMKLKAGNYDGNEARRWWVGPPSRPREYMALLATSTGVSEEDGTAKRLLARIGELLASREQDSIPMLQLFFMKLKVVPFLFPAEDHDQYVAYVGRFAAWKAEIGYRD